MARQLYNAGSDIIQAFLQGQRIKQAREDSATQAEIARINAELRAQAIEDKANQFQQRLQQDMDVAKATDEYRKAQLRLQATGLKYKGLEAIRTGKLQSADGKAIDVGALLPEESMFRGLVIPTQEQQTLQEVEKAGAIAGAQAAAKQPYARENALLADESKTKQELLRQQFLGTQKDLDRKVLRENKLLEVDARLKAAATRSVGRASERNAEKQAAKMDAVEAFAPDIIDGSVALEDLPKGEVGLAIQTKLRGDKIKILTRKERDNLISLKSLENFYNKVGELNTILQSGNILNQATNTKVAQLQEELQADLTVFGREAKAEKGVISDKDIERLKGSIPTLLPGGMRGVFSDKSRAEANKRRTDNIEKLYFEKSEGLLRGMTPAQRAAIEGKFALMPRVQKVEE